MDLDVSTSGGEPTSARKGRKGTTEFPNVHTNDGKARCRALPVVLSGMQQPPGRPLKYSQIHRLFKLRNAEIALFQQSATTAT